MKAEEEAESMDKESETDTINEGEKIEGGRLTSLTHPMGP